MRRIERENTGYMEPEHDLVVAGYIARRGAAEIVKARWEELSHRFSQNYLEEVISYEEIILPETFSGWNGYPISECQPVREGGILKAVWDLSGAYGMGVEFSLAKIPVRQETIEICEEYDRNPYRMYTDNCILLTAARGDRLTQRLHQEGIPAAVIGRVKKGIAREILTEEGIGYLERPQEDELKKFLPEYFG